MGFEAALAVGLPAILASLQSFLTLSMVAQGILLTEDESFWGSVEYLTVGEGGVKQPLRRRRSSAVSAAAAASAAEGSSNASLASKPPGPSAKRPAPKELID
eukprot:TRINITY_DN26996_c0_g1_i1.p2 TRINITY_DN26996_c0_g1~~TRINITY_DN26996_c0_g1_i1.p2  ORF type:complete len:102 (+),score=26.77 TRINITY_DN26996_c0_g1_i1:628-933(+)